MSRGEDRVHKGPEEAEPSTIIMKPDKPRKAEGLMTAPVQALERECVCGGGGGKDQTRRRRHIASTTQDPPKT